VLLGIDFGSSGCKGVLFDAHGRVLAAARHEYAPVCVGSDGCEMDAEVFFEGFVSVVRKISAKGTIAAIGVSSHGETVIPIRGDGLPAGPALMNSDSRGLRQVRRLEEGLRREMIYRQTGMPPHPMYSLPKIMWLRDERPDIYKSAAKFCTVPGFIASRLGLAPLVDYTLASRFMAFDIHRLQWSAMLLEAAGIAPTRFCEPVPAGASQGKIPQAFAKELGLGEGVEFILAGHDQPCGAFGAGVSHDESALSAGSYECLGVIGSAPVTDDRALACGFNSYCHVVDGAYITLAFFPGAICVNWFAGMLYGREHSNDNADTLFARIYEDMQRHSGPTGLLITPHLIGACNPGWNPLARCGVYGLHPGLDRGGIVKGVFEGIACELKLNLDSLRELGIEVNDIRIHGGNAGSVSGVQLRADITGRRFIRVHDKEAGCRGAAMLAGYGAGFFSSKREAAESMGAEGSQFHPNGNEYEAYLRQYERYRQFYGATINL
jgi:xylulokinase